MKTSIAERSTEESSSMGDASIEDLPSRERRKKQSLARPPTAANPKRTIAVISQSDWPLPLPHSAPSHMVPTKPRCRPQNDAIRLSASELETLAALHERCKAVGIKLKKTELLAIGLKLLAAAPTGKLLAILGPHESSEFTLKRKKKKAPTRA